MRAIGALLTNDGASVQLCAAVASATRRNAPVAAQLQWSPPLPLLAPSAPGPDADAVLDAADADELAHGRPARGGRVLMDLLAKRPRALGHTWRVPQLLARIVAADMDDVTPPDLAALKAAATAEKAALSAQQAGASDAATADQLAALYEACIGATTAYVAALQADCDQVCDANDLSLSAGLRREHIRLSRCFRNALTRDVEILFFDLNANEFAT